METPNQQKSLLRADYCHRKEVYHWESKGIQKWLYLCHRLDSPTSGIIIGCPRVELTSIVKRPLEKKIKKTYFAITANPRIRMGTWKDSLAERNYWKTEVQPGKGSIAITKA